MIVRSAPSRAAAASSPTAMPPALITANQHAAIAGLFGPRSSTRLPGTSAEVLDQHARDAVRALGQLRVGPAHAARREDRRALAPAARERVVEKRGRAVQPVGILELRPIEDEAPATRRAAAGCRARTCRHARTERSDLGLHGAIASCGQDRLQQIATDDQLLHLGRAFVDAQRADLAVQPLDDDACAHARARRAAAARRRSPAAPTRSRPSSPSPPRASCARPLHVALPRRARSEQRRGVDLAPPSRRASPARAAARRACRRTSARAFARARRLVERAPREADRRGGDRRAKDVERAHRELEALALRAEQRVGRHAATVEDSSRASGCGAITSMRSATIKPGRVRRNDERRDAALRRPRRRCARTRSRSRRCRRC